MQKLIRVIKSRPILASLLATFLASLLVTLIVAAITVGLVWRSTPDLDPAFEKCIDGSASRAEAVKVGKLLAEHKDNLRFDASIFSPDCGKKIADSLFRDFDEIPSTILVRYFWSDPFIARAAELLGETDVSCNLGCLLLRDMQRPLPSDALFRSLVQAGTHYQNPGGQFMLARSLVIATDAPISELLDLIPEPSARKNVLRLLYLLEGPSVIRDRFRRTSEQGACMGSNCISFKKPPTAENCEQLKNQFAAASGLEEAVSLKFALIDNPSLSHACIRADSTEALLTQHFQLGMYGRNVDLAYLINGYRQGFLKDIDFANGDVGSLDNVKFEKMNSVSTSSAATLVGQIERAPDPAPFVQNIPSNVSSLLLSTESGARFQMLRCKSSGLRGNQPCDRRSIYLHMIGSSLHDKPSATFYLTPLTKQ